VRRVQLGSGQGEQALVRRELELLPVRVPAAMLLQAYRRQRAGLLPTGGGQELVGLARQGVSLNARTSY